MSGPVGAPPASGHLTGRGSPARRRDRRPRPLALHQRQLRWLCHELGHPAAVERFLRTFLELLPSRVREVTEAVRHCQRDPEEVAANLAAISAMIGADRFAAQLARLATGTDRWPATTRAGFIEETHAEATELRRALLCYLTAQTPHLARVPAPLPRPCHRSRESGVRP